MIRQVVHFETQMMETAALRGEPRNWRIFVVPLNEFNLCRSTVPQRQKRDQGSLDGIPKGGRDRKRAERFPPPFYGFLNGSDGVTDMVKGRRAHSDRLLLDTPSQRFKGSRIFELLVVHFNLEFLGNQCQQVDLRNGVPLSQRGRRGFGIAARIQRREYH